MEHEVLQGIFILARSGLSAVFGAHLFGQKVVSKVHRHIPIRFARLKIGVFNGHRLLWETHPKEGKSSEKGALRT
jgi:hypothetical protein